MKRLLSIIPLLLCALLLAFPASAAAQYANAAEMYADWDQNGYPDDVCSVYSTDGEGSMCILLLEDTPEREAELLALLEDPSRVSFGTGVYSHNEMAAACDEIVREYLGGAVVSCGIGWSSAGGGAKGFGESGFESRVMVSVTAEKASEYEALFAGKYGDMVVVEAVEGAPVAAVGVGEEYDSVTDRARSSSWLIPAAAFVLLALTGVFLAGRAKASRAAQTTTGHIVAGHTPPSRAQVIRAIRESSRTPDSRVLENIRKRLR